MIFADKLILLRKNHNMSREEFASSIDAPLESVLEWEEEKSIPDLNTIIGISSLFNVSTDYLLKEELEEYIEKKEIMDVKKISKEEAEKFLDVSERAGRYISFAIFLLIISPIEMINLFVIGDIGKYDVSSYTLNIIGISVMVSLIFISVILIIKNISKLSKFKYISEEVFEIEDSLLKLLRNAKDDYRKIFRIRSVIGTILCFTSVLPIFLSTTINKNDDLLFLNMFSVTLVMLAAGIFVLSGADIMWVSFKKILQEDEYSVKNKKRRFETSQPLLFSIIFWLFALVGFLGYSLYTDSFEYSWIILLGALFIYIIIIIAATLIPNKSKHDNKNNVVNEVKVEEVLVESMDSSTEEITVEGIQEI